MANKYKKDFPILKRKIHGKELHYLDNAATSQMPQQVIDALVDFETNHRANVHRGIHTLSEEATVMYNDSRSTIAKFINAVVPEEIIFVRNTTEAINMVAYSWGRANLKKGDIILATEIEHHSNLTPWQEVCNEIGAELQIIPVNSDGEILIKNVNVDWDKVKLVSLVHISNVLGSVADVKQITKQIKKKYESKDKFPKFLLDAAQSVPHMPVNIQKLGVDFMAFSGHKMCGPMGIGVLWIKRELLNELDPYLSGGGTVKTVTYEKTDYREAPEKFEAGTPNISGAIGLAAACEYLNSIGVEKIMKQEKELVDYAMSKLLKRDDVTIYGPTDLEKKAGVISFNLENVPSHDLATILDTEGVAIRSGHHCVMPWHKKQNITTTARMSFYLYNTKKDVDALLDGLDKAKKIFKGVFKP